MKRLMDALADLVAAAANDLAARAVHRADLEWLDAYKQGFADGEAITQARAAARCGAATCPVRAGDPT